METMVQWLDRVLSALEGEGLDPVTIVLEEGQFEALQKLSEPDLRTSTDGTLRYRGAPVYRAREREGSSIVGRAVSGKTTRVPLPEPHLAGPGPHPAVSPNIAAERQASED